MKACMKGSHGNWLAADYHSELSQQVREAFQNEHYPELVVIKSDGTIVTKNGIKDVKKYGSGAISVWRGEALPRRTFSYKFHKLCGEREK